MSQNQCAEKAGFLFSHACDKAAQWQCGRCQKMICEDHSFRAQNETLCTACTKADEKKAKQQSGAMSGRYRDDPYFYSTYHYHGYGYYGRGSWGYDSYYAYGSGYHDGNDFTEADGAALAHEGDEAWEEDMGAS